MKIKRCGTITIFYLFRSIMSDLFNSRDLINHSVFESQTPHRDKEIYDLKTKISNQELLLDKQNQNLKSSTELIKKLNLKLDEMDKKFKKHIGESDALVEQLDAKLFSVREENRILKINANS